MNSRQTGHAVFNMRKRDNKSTHPPARVTVPQVNPVRVGERLQSLGVGRGWTGEDIARATGIPRGSIGAIETGRMVPDIARILAFAVLYGVSTDYIIRGRRQPGDPSDGDAGSIEN